MPAHHGPTPHPLMHMARELSTPAERIRWAIAHSGHRLVDVAQAVGCSHAALSQWQTGATTVENIKVGLLMRFCHVTGASLPWLLSGDGPRLARYAAAQIDSPLVATAVHIAREEPPETARMAERLLQALVPAAPAAPGVAETAGKPPATPATPAHRRKR